MKQARGFTLIEILITTVVFGLGLLGVTALNGKGQQVAYKSYQAQVATWQINDLVEQIRTNESNIASYTYDPAAPPNPAPAKQDCIADTSNGTSGCTPAQLASHTVAQWLEDLGNILPSGKGKIESVAGDTYRITVMWDEDRTGATGTACGDDLSVDLHCLSLEADFRP